MTKSAAPKNALASQLAAMSGNVAAATINPQSRIARFVFGDVKGGEAKHNFVMSEIAAAIVQALKGNQRDIPEALKVCAGKSKKARAYAAGFGAIIHDLKPEAYAGKYDAAENAPVRARVAERSKSLEFEFESAYLTVMTAPAEPKAPKAKKATEADADEAAPATASDEAAPIAIVNGDHAVVDVGLAVDAVARAFAGGLLSAAEIQIVRMALIAHDEAQASAAAAVAIASATEAATAE